MSMGHCSSAYMQGPQPAKSEPGRCVQIGVNQLEGDKNAYQDSNNPPKDRGHGKIPGRGIVIIKGIYLRHRDWELEEDEVGEFDF